MRVLVVAQHLYNEKLPKFRKNKTGYGIIINQIVEYVSKECDVYFFSNVITNEIRLGNAVIVKHNWLDVLKGFSVREVVRGLSSFLRSKQSLRDRLLYIYHRINSNVLRKEIERLRPDVIHCNGVGEKYLYYVDACVESGVPTINTLHGLIGLSDTIKAYSEDKKSEIAFLRRAEAFGIPTTVISTGILKRIERVYNIHDTSFITVINNGTNVSDDELEDFKNETLEVPDNTCVIITVGTVAENKNQVQIIRSLALLPEELRSRSRLYILGTVVDSKAIDNAIKYYGLESSVFCRGFVSRDKLGAYYRRADLNVLASHDEGFGLALIEGFVFGVPSVTFEDIDAVQDIYDDNAMILCQKRSDEDLACTIEKALKRQWNKEYIKKYGRTFSLDKMAENYITLYKRVVENDVNKASSY